MNPSGSMMVLKDKKVNWIRWRRRWLTTRGNTYERLKLNYSTSGELTTSTPGGIQATTITSGTGAEIEVQFTGFDYPPVAIMVLLLQHALQQIQYERSKW